MEYRLLGSTGLQVSVLGLGCNRLGRPRPGHTRGDMVRLLEHAVDAGVTFYDTAESYVDGESELMLGEVFGRGRREVVIATKIGWMSRVPRPLLARAQPIVQVMRRYAPRLARASARWRQALGCQDFSPEYLRRAVEECMQRLRSDRLDIVQLYNPSAAVMQRDDTFEILERLKAEGTIRFYGVTFGNWHVAPPIPQKPGVSTLQAPINVVDEGGAREILSWAKSRGVGVIANQPFKKGQLLGSGSRDLPGRDPRTSLAQTALRAIVQMSGVSVVLAGTTGLAHLREDVAAINAPPLTESEIAWLRAALSPTSC